MRARRRLAMALAGAALLYTGWLLWMTLCTQAEVVAKLRPLSDAIDRSGVPVERRALLLDTAGNIGVFVPLGLLLAAIMPGRWWLRLAVATAAGGLLSGFIELSQRTVPGRYSSVEDWLLNVLGAGLGAMLMARGGWLRGPAEPGSK
jgi:glycopeptide antibiotics resistance protein